MMKKFNEFINEDLRSKNVSPKIKCDNLKSIYPKIQVQYTNDLKIAISYDRELTLNKQFYDALENDGIKKDDIVFENCEEIRLRVIDEFTTVSDYGVLGENIKHFYCSNCNNLTSLEGSPKEVGSFNCWGCNGITSLKGAPEIVRGRFDCIWCKNLESLEGSPEKVRGMFFCQNCKDSFIEQVKEKYGDNKVIS